MEHWKFITGSAVAAIAAVADAATDLEGWEDFTVKGMLIAAVLYLVRELAVQRSYEKNEAKEREKTVTQALDRNSDVLEKLVVATNEQTAYYRDVAKEIINSTVHGKRQ